MRECEPAFHYRPGLNPAFVRKVMERKRKEEEQKRLRKEKADAEKARKKFEAAMLREQQKREREEREREERAKASLANVLNQYREIIVLGVKRSVKDIIHETAQLCRVSVDDIMGRSSQKRIADARHLAMYRIRKERPDMSLPQIGRVFDRDHTTVIAAIRKIECQRSGKDPHEWRKKHAEAA